MNISHKLAAMALFGSVLSAGSLNVESPYVRAVPPNIPNSAAFMVLKNTTDKPLSVIRAESTLSNMVELHTHSKQGDMMVMHQVPEIVVPANGETVLKPGGLHVMFMGLKSPINVNDTVEFTLVTDNGEKIPVKAPARQVKRVMEHGKSH